MVDEEEIMGRLGEVMDPETNLSIVDMGFIYDVEVKDSAVNIEMTLTSPGCPMHSHFTEKVREKISELEGVDDVSVEVTFDPPWSPDMMSDKAKKKLGMGNE